MTNFENIAFSGKLKKAIKRIGYRKATEVQEKTIPLIIRGKNVVSKSFTGSGKTAAFGIALSERILQGKSNAVLVLCPTRELALQVSKEISQINASTGLKAIVVYGGHNMSDETAALRKRFDFLCATPGRLLDHISRRAFNPRMFDTVVLDEADRMLDMGFIADIKDILGKVRPDHTHLFSATLTGEVAKLIERHIPEFEEVLIHDEIVGINIFEKRVTFSGRDKFRHLLEILERNAGERVLVFVSTKRYADLLNSQLKDKGFKATSIHGGKSQKGREISLNNFKSGRKNILIATDVAARGLQIDDIECVVNYDRPRDADTYKHRIGRTGRMGKKGLAITFVPEDARSRDFWADEQPAFQRGQRRPGFRGRPSGGQRSGFRQPGRPQTGFHGNPLTRRRKSRPRKSSDVNDYIYRI